MIKNKLKKKLLLHSCCAPCLTSSFEQTKGDFLVVPFWFNPNIEPNYEYQKRLNNFDKLTNILKIDSLIIDQYKSDNRKWQKMISGLENEPEGGIRCEKCIKSRLEKTATEAKKRDFKIFGTTMTVSPRKNAFMINKIGNKLAKKHKIDFLEVDFKKKDGYLLSVKLSKKYDLYRQNYCGCRYSKSKE